MSLVRPRRVLLVDPVCISERGHNLPLLLDYRTFLSQAMDAEVEVHGSSLLAERVCAETGVKPSFPFAYSHVSQLMTNLHLQVDAGGDERDNREALGNAFAKLFAEEDRPLQIVFPYADYLGVLGCADAVDALADPLQVSVSLRFIGVMEHAGPLGIDTLAKLAQAVVVMRQRGCKVSLSAESAPYAAVLSARLGEYVDLVPPPAPAWPRQPRKEIAHVETTPLAYCPGSGRGDKGFTTLPAIVTRYRRLYPDSSLTFVCQEPVPSLDGALHEAQIRLQATPGVQVLPSMITTDEMVRLYAAAKFTFLPYDPVTYRLRSSASLADAIAACSPVVTFTGTGLEPYVSNYGNGKTAGNVEAIIEACHDMSMEDRRSWTRRTEAARWRYDQDVDSAWRRWLQRAS